MGKSTNTREIPVVPFSTLAGHRCLDLTNTVAWRLDPVRRIDRIPDRAAALDWIGEFEVCRPTEGTKLQRLRGDDVLRHLTTVREHIRAAAWEGQSDAAEVLVELNRQWWERVELVPDGEQGWQHRDGTIDARTPALRLAHETVELITDLPAPIKQCADEACGWIYLDTSPRHNRRWCSSEDCGARNRSRTHYHQRRKLGSAP